MVEFSSDSKQVVHYTFSDFDPCLCPGWSIPHGFFPGTVKGRNMSVGYKSIGTYLKNRRDLVFSLRMDPEKMMFPCQVHGGDVFIVTKDIPSDAPDCDGLVTDVPGITLCVSTADCAPVMFWDTESVVGICHAGWKGVFLGVLENTLAAVRSVSKSPLKVQACIGPTIRLKNYEVSCDFYHSFIKEDPESCNFFQKEEKLFFDLPGYIAFRLSKKECKVFDTLEDTYESRFFSRRHHKKQNFCCEYGFGSMIGLPI
ncbi:MULTISPECIES: polyphenol oxidase family protein [Holospora]|uniref:Laccase domain protein n=2 Tax=Holospora TaxID=44747 RepID=A0A061JJ06_9PROT|nr:MULTISPECIES: polyphenol oxidase family protein [Holospora]ETZ05479.1 laccase domain protein [Holospora undulata HU1]GAJ46668.1 laccase domain protein [Holospora elegans E1]